METLDVRALTAGYGKQPIIFDVSATFSKGTITAIVGPNGAGKSTFLKSLFGLTSVHSGEVYLQGERMALSARRLVQAGIAYVPQVGNVFPSLSVADNLEIGIYVRDGGSLSRVLELFPDLRPALKKPAGDLSGGQRNMLAVGRALMSDPIALLLDEATGGLAPIVATQLWQYLVELARSGICVIAVEQNVRLALDFSDDVYLFASGRNRLHGPPAELLARHDFEAFFLEPSAL
jgi:branched-chain amino acid transport system ATP-binding protein